MNIPGTAIQCDGDTGTLVTIYDQESRARDQRRGVLRQTLLADRVRCRLHRRAPQSKRAPHRRLARRPKRAGAARSRDARATSSSAPTASSHHQRLPGLLRVRDSRSRDIAMTLEIKPVILTHSVVVRASLIRRAGQRRTASGHDVAPRSSLRAFDSRRDSPRMRRFRHLQQSNSRPTVLGQAKLQVCRTPAHRAARHPPPA